MPSNPRAQRALELLGPEDSSVQRFSRLGESNSPEALQALDRTRRLEREFPGGNERPFRALEQIPPLNQRNAHMAELLGPEGSRVARIARTGAPDQDSDPAALQADRQTAELQQKEPAANDLIDMIRARNVHGRRGLQLPSYLGGSPTRGMVNALRANASNLRFKMNPPVIDAAGNVAPTPAPPYDPRIPLELQYMLMTKDDARKGVADTAARLAAARAGAAAMFHHWRNPTGGTSP